MSLKIGDSVVIDKCDECSAVVGKMAKVVGITLNDPQNSDRVQLNFGRGRPQANRPSFIPIEDVSLDRSSDVTNSAEVSDEVKNDYGRYIDDAHGR